MNDLMTTTLAQLTRPIVMMSYDNAHYSKYCLTLTKSDTEQVIRMICVSII
jgi:hypothetical protein